jgi:hypothetical protein
VRVEEKTPLLSEMCSNNKNVSYGKGLVNCLTIKHLWISVQVKPVITTVRQCQWFTACDRWNIDGWENKDLEDKLSYLQISILMMQGLNCRLNGHIYVYCNVMQEMAVVFNKYEEFLPSNKKRLLFHIS